MNGVLQYRMDKGDDWAIRAEALSKTFHGRKRSVEAVRDVSFHIRPGERVACIGPNGAGKSTTIKMLTGILQPTSGTVSVLGMVPWKHRRKLAMEIGVLFGQRSQLFNELTARDGLRLLAAIYRVPSAPAKRRVDELAELLVATDIIDQPVRSLSLGQRMRCELAASLFHKPALLFLDEPTIGLDLLAKQRFRELLVDLNERLSTTLFLTSHDVADLEAVADRVIVINHGLVIFDGNIDAISATFLSTKLISVRFVAPPITALTFPGALVKTDSETCFSLELDTSVADLRSALDYLLQAGTVADFSVIDPPLEEVIADVYRRSQ